MISAREESDLRPQLERLGRLIARSEGIDPAASTFAFRPLWQMDAARLNASQKRQNNANGYRWGCHRCGTKDPGTGSVNFIGDHQPPTALNPESQPQFIYPHCQDCSIEQGGYVKG